MLRLRKLKQGISRAMAHIGSLLRQALKGPSEGWVTFVLLLLSVMLAVWSVRRAWWAPTPGLYLLTFCGLMLGLLLAKTRFKGWLLAVGVLLLGICLSVWQLTSLVEGATSLDRYATVVNHLLMWSRALLGGEVSRDTLLASFLLLVTSWLGGFICSWSLFRKHNIWGAMLPSGIVMAVNTAILDSEAQNFRLYLYLFLICLLVARLSVLERERDWTQRNVRRRQLDSVLLPKGLRFALTVVIVTSILPIPSARFMPIAAVWNSIHSPVRVIREELARGIRGVPVEDPVTNQFFGYTSDFGASITLREEPVLIVRAPFPVYLRARSYDVYTHKGWQTGDTQMVSPKTAAQEEPGGEPQKSKQVEVSVTVQSSLIAGDPVYLCGYPVDMSIGYRLEVLQPARYRISFSETQAGLVAEVGGLPVDLREAALRLQEISRASLDKLTEADIRSALPEDVRVIACEFGTEGIEKVVVERHVPIRADTLSVRTAVPISAGASYRATTNVPTVTRNDLLAAGTGYPGWVLDTYLQLPDTMPSRIMYLAQELTRGAETPYEKAVAICNYLRTLEYTVDIQAPPEGTDGVDYFLFELRRGYCQYFASAMTVLLRTSGVPSRMVVGYGPGELTEQHGLGDAGGHSNDGGQDLRDTFVVRNSHSWSEAFFPGYGWMPFEPTPAQPLIVYGEAGLPPQDAGDIDDPIVEPDDASTPAAWNFRLLGISLGLVLLAAMIWLAWRRLLGKVAEPRAAYARMGYLAALSGMGPRQTLTPQEYGRQLAATVPGMATSLDRILHAYMRVSYSNHSLSNEDRSGVTKAWPQVRNHLLRYALRSTLPSRFHGKRPQF